MNAGYLFLDIVTKRSCASLKRTPNPAAAGCPKADEDAGEIPPNPCIESGVSAIHFL